MVSRNWAAVVVAIVGVSSLSASSELAARGGGGFGGRGPAFSMHRVTAFHGFRPNERFFNRRNFGGGWGGGGFGYPVVVPGGSFDYPPDYAPSDESGVPPPVGGPAYAAGVGPAVINPVVVYRPGCTTQHVTVPSEAGGQRTINIMRC
jgi:hypothetical protein